jgi:spoIIIJ-associated protein
MKEYKFEGRSESEALQTASEQLGVLPEDLEYEVVDRRTGLIGIGRSVRIKVRFRQELGAPDEDHEADEGAPARAPVDAVAPAVEPDDVDVDEDAAPVARAEADEPEEDEDPEIPISERAERAADVVARIVEGMGLTCEVTPAETMKTITLCLETDDDNLVIGKGGSVLDATQFLVNKIVNRFPEDRKFVVVDVNNYRKRKSDSLERFARDMCKKAARTGRTIRLRDLNPRERRMVHMVVTRFNEVTSRSEGDRDGRVLCIEPRDS